MARIAVRVTGGIDDIAKEFGVDKIGRASCRERV